MSVQIQKSIARPVTLSGVGLHTGEPAQLVLMPAQAFFGVSFVRTDLLAQRGGAFSLDAATIPVSPRLVRDARLGVWLENAAGASVRTVEHLLAALSLAGVDNVLIEIDGPEVPILDGSAGEFLDLIRGAGVKPLDAPRRAIVVDEPVRIDHGERFVEALPCDTAEIEVTIDFEDAAIGRQSIAFRLGDEAVAKRLATARTFCLLREVEAMRAAGLGRGGSLDNALVVDGDRLLNESGLRDPQEFVLHKALDLIGDLALVGAPIVGHIRAHKLGHDLNTRLAGRLADVASGRREEAAEPPVERLTA